MENWFAGKFMHPMEFLIFFRIGWFHILRNFIFPIFSRTPLDLCKANPYRNPEGFGTNPPPALVSAFHNLRKLPLVCFN